MKGRGRRQGSLSQMSVVSTVDGKWEDMRIGNRQSEGTVYTAEKGRREAGVQMRVWSEEGSLGGGAWSGCLVPNQAILSPWLF